MTSEYDIPGLRAAAPAFGDAARAGEDAARTVAGLRARQESSRASLPVQLDGLDRRLRAWAEEVQRTVELLTRTATEVGDADRRTALELSAAALPVPGTARAERPAGVGPARGDTGAAVRSLQRRLAAAGFDPGTVDGKFGPRTQAAVEAYQRRAGLEVTGRADLATATALLNEPPAAVPAGANGRLPDAALAGVGDGERMATGAAAAFNRMDAAAREAGIDLRVNSGYRTHAEQAELYERYRNGTGNLAAAPGRSTHGLGLSADISVRDPATLRWLRAHAGGYGFVNDVPGEAWHWTWRR
jgi:peptidoglycan hydrolase-like protein with peptidoglycan-binding domain